MGQNKIIIKGAREHNLKNIDVEIPRNKLIVITGLSGSGKSSLAFDTIYAEGQRRYVESLSAYARQFLGQMEKPDLDYIAGLSPAIAIDQKAVSKNPRSTVGTVTEIYDYLRLLYARIGKVHCYHCGKPIEQQTVEQMVDRLMTYPQGMRLQILAPVVRGKKGEFQKIIEQIRREGYVRLRVNGEIKDINEKLYLDKQKRHTIEVVVDRVILRPGITSRLADSLETALNLSGGLVNVLLNEDEVLFNQHFACPDCGISFAEISPRLFSFNSPYGACPQCDGLGFMQEFDLQLVVPDKSKTLAEGVFVPWQKRNTRWQQGVLQAVVEHFQIPQNIPFNELSTAQQKLLLYGAGKKKIRCSYYNHKGELRVFDTVYEGIIPNLKRRYQETKSGYVRRELEAYMSQTICSACRGFRLKKESLAVLIEGKNIGEITSLSVGEALDFFQTLKLSKREKIIAQQVLKEICARLQFLVDVGLDYLTLRRTSGTLSGGEAQRIRLATQIGSGLVGVLYILDEPSIGLHQRDNQRLINTLKSLRDLGNTVIVVEHDQEMMAAADQIIDIGPGAGVNGGKIIAQGTFEQIKEIRGSLTADYLSGRKQILVPPVRRKLNDQWLVVRGAQAHNLKNVEVSIPLGVFTCVTGVSGSGKSTLVNEIIYKALAVKLNRARCRPGNYQSLSGLEYLEKVVNIDQAPIGRTPRSNPATYTGAFDGIRELFAQTKEARMRGYRPGRFSFNVRGGRCEACGGNGIIKIEMHFLPDVYVSCEVCKGTRFMRETLEVKYKGKSIAEVLEMTVDEAAEFFQHHLRIYRRLKLMQDVGLGYLRLGQPATTLSGGEAQRIKLASELSRRNQGQTLYILDEPTTGLHLADIKKLLNVLERLVDAGNTVLVIEHHLDVIKTADYCIDLGPEGGQQGGCVVAVGTPEELAENPASYTGKYLKKVL
ncbi:MAG TPA: excinuclease ABC subunit UvrA [Clostridia bacterium]|nr:excinuclease ABC subunit UvrA [Clostridia bacterium]